MREGGGREEGGWYEVQCTVVRESTHSTEDEQ